MDFYFNLTLFYQIVPILEENCLVLWMFWPKTYMCVCGCRPVVYSYKVNVLLLRRSRKRGRGIMDNFPLQPHHFIPSQPSFWRKSESRPDYLKSAIQWPWLTMDRRFELLSDYNWHPGCVRTAAGVIRAYTDSSPYC